MSSTQYSHTGCARILTSDQVQAMYHQSEGYLASLKVPQPGGSEVIFAEATAIKEGVWNGLYEPADVLRNAAPSMLGKYVVLGHPDSNTSPSWPDEALGQVVDVAAEGDEARIRLLLALWKNRMPPELLQRFLSGEKVSVSVGLNMYATPQEGTWNGKPYEQVANKIYFEHLGIVPVGACTPEDGCSAQIITQSTEAEEGNTANDTEKDREMPAESKNVCQAMGAPIEAAPPDMPPPLFKDPDELLAFTNEALKISDNPELRDQQLSTAFDFVMDTIREYGWNIWDIPEGNARAMAMAAFVARAAEAWRSNDPLFTPPNPMVVAQATQNNRSKSWRGDAKMTVTQAKKSEEGEVKALYKYPVLSQTEDGTPQFNWNSTDDESVAIKAKEECESAISSVLSKYDNTLKEFQAAADAGAVADGIARGLLLGNLKSALPKLSEDSLERYKAMPLPDLAGIVSDLGQGSAPAAAPAAAPAIQAPETKEAPEAKAVTQAPTPVNLQTMKRAKPLSFAEAKARIKKELGVEI